MGVLTEPVPGTPGPQRHPGAWCPGMYPDSGGAAYGAPAAARGVVAWTPQHVTPRAGHAGVGGDITPADFTSIVGRAPAIGITRP